MKSSDKNWKITLKRLNKLPNSLLYYLLKNELKVKKSISQNNFINDNFDDSERYLFSVAILTEHPYSKIKKELDKKEEIEKLIKQHLQFCKNNWPKENPVNEELDYIYTEILQMEGDLGAFYNQILKNKVIDTSLIEVNTGIITKLKTFKKVSSDDEKMRKFCISFLENMNKIRLKVMK